MSELPDLLVGAIDQLRAQGDEKTAMFLESLAPAVGFFLNAQASRRNESRVFFVADQAARMLQSQLDVDSHDARRAVTLAMLLLTEAEKAVG